MALREGLSPKEVSVVVYKSKGRLELYGDGELIGTADCIVGKNRGHKKQEGDYRTPEGDYYIVTRNDKSNYTLFFGLNYPNAADAEAGKQAGLIDEAEYGSIVAAAEQLDPPPWDTEMGGWIGIHGKGEGRDDTQGCIAVADKDIRVLDKYLKLGCKVSIYE